MDNWRVSSVLSVKIFLFFFSFFTNGNDDPYPVSFRIIGFSPTHEKAALINGFF